MESTGKASDSSMDLNTSVQKQRYSSINARVPQENNVSDITLKGRLKRMRVVTSTESVIQIRSFIAGFFIFTPLLYGERPALAFLFSYFQPKRTSFIKCGSRRKVEPLPSRN